MTTERRGAYKIGVASKDEGGQTAVNVELGGSTYRMVTDAPAEELQRLASEVDRRIHALGAKALRTLSPAQALAIASLRLAEELDEERAKSAATLEAWRNAATKAQSSIDRALDKVRADAE
ncbi:MAG: cell division protein ZapA [Myxococcota bacterium]